MSEEKSGEGRDIDDIDHSNPDDLRQLGNHQFAHKNYEAAAALYSQALELVGKDYFAAAEANEAGGDMPEPPTSLLLNLCNRSACFFQMENFEEARKDAEMAWNSLPQLSNVKAAYRLAKTLIALDKFEEGKDVILQVFQVLEEVEVETRKEMERENKQKMRMDPKAKKKDTKPDDSPTATQRKAFEELLKSLERKRKNQGKEPPKLSIRDFKIEDELGFGNFSEIYKVSHKESGKEFALKRINKKKAADLGQKQHPNVHNEILMEKRTLCERLSSTKQTNHPFIVQMHAAFDDYEHIYFLSDLHTECGDLWSRLKHKDKKMVGCHRSQAKQWLYQLVDAIEHMHKHGIVHRDLKPENLLLDSRNHVIVIDFGTAKDLVFTNLNGPEFVGTPDFMSPEAVKGGRADNQDRSEEDYPDAGCGADLWALGAIAYILHTGETPFWSPSPFLTFLKIKRCQLTRGWGVADDDAWDFIDKLIKVNPKHRLGANVFEVDKTKRMMVQKDPNGYDCLRKHEYLKEFHNLPAEKKVKNPVPSLRDLAIRACVELVKKDSIDFEALEKHQPGDGSKHDMTRLGPRDRRCVMHLCDKLQLFKVAGDAVGQQPRLYSRFFTDIVHCRLFSKYQERLGTADFCGLTQMNDGHGRTPSSFNEDPYATPIKVEPVKIAVITNPLFCSGDKVFDDDSRKNHKKDLKKCVAAINRERPKLVIVNGPLEESKKILARISDSIPVLANDGSGSFYTAWYWSIQCISLSTKGPHLSSTGTPQMKWLREQLEASRMSKHPLFVSVDCDPRELPEYVQKRLARGRTGAIIGHCAEAEGNSYIGRVSYAHKVEGPVKKGKQIDSDDTSIRSTDSDDDENDDYSSKAMGCRVNAVRWFTVSEDGEWKQRLEEM